MIVYVNQLDVSPATRNIDMSSIPGKVKLSFLLRGLVSYIISAFLACNLLKETIQKHS